MHEGKISTSEAIYDGPEITKQMARHYCGVGQQTSLWTVSELIEASRAARVIAAGRSDATK